MPGVVRFTRPIPHSVTFFKPRVEAPGEISSAGVYDSNGELVRTLWSAEFEHPYVNNPSAFWNRLLDNGDIAPTGTYEIKVLRHNCTYTWEGVLGNTSPDHRDNWRYHNYAGTITDMVIAPDGEMYFTTNYCERWNTIHVATTADPQHADYVREQDFRGTLNQTFWCATDGIRTYWHRWTGAGRHYVFATDNSDYSYPVGVGYWGKKERVVFAEGETQDGVSVLAFTEDFQFILSLAVQRIGDFLFVGRIEDAGSPNFTYSILTLDKTTGELLYTNELGYGSQFKIVCDPTNDDYLWVAYSTTDDDNARDKISQLFVDGSGFMIETGVHITGLTTVRGMDISPDGTRILVADGGTSQQIKAFSTTDGSVQSAFGTSGAFGTAGGYAGAPAVTKTKFMMETYMGFGAGGGWLAYQADGSFWFGDAGNCRYMHFSAGNSPTWIEEIAYIPAIYPVRVCRGDDTKVFAQYLEFEIDYSVPLSHNTGWTLKNNWHYDLLVTETYRTLLYAAKLSNGRYYCTVPASGVAETDREVYEMTSTGLRATGAVFSANWALDNDYNIILQVEDTVPYRRGRAAMNAFAGFDGSQNPSWAEAFGAGTDIWTSEELPGGFPLVQLVHNAEHDMVSSLSNGVIPIWDPHSLYTPGGGEYHLGGIRESDGEVVFQTHQGTPANHGGINWFLSYPPKPGFGLGNTITDNGGGSISYRPGHAHVFTSYCGEGWGANQTNMWSHWHETGLLVERFGETAPYFGTANSKAPYADLDQAGLWAENITTSSFSFKGMERLAGNQKQGGLAYVNGKYYIYHNDEWYHGGVHRWKVDGLDSIRVFSTPIVWNSGDYVSPTPDPYNLLAGLPFDDADLADGAGGWSRTPTSNVGATINSSPPVFHFYTNAIIVDPHLPPDLAFVAYNATDTLTAAYDLPRAGSGDWGIDSTVIWANALSTRIRLCVLDVAGKKIIEVKSGYVFPTGACLYVNGIPARSPITADNLVERWQHYSSALRDLVMNVDVSAGTIAVTYGENDLVTVSSVAEVGADITDPAVFRITYEQVDD